MADTPQDVVNRELREFRRYTGDGLPGEPVNAPLPVGDPQSGVHNPKKHNLRKALMAPVEAAAQSASDAKDEADRAGEEADRSDAAADRAENSASSFIEVATNFKTVTALLADETMGYAGSGKDVIVGEGDIVTAQGFRYEVVAGGAVDEHVETAGGVKLYVSPNVGNFNTVNVVALGADPTGVNSSQSAFEKAIAGWGYITGPGGHYVFTDTIVTGNRKSIVFPGAKLTTFWLGSACPFYTGPDDFPTTDKAPLFALASGYDDPDLNSYPIDQFRAEGFTIRGDAAVDAEGLVSDTSGPGGIDVTWTKDDIRLVDVHFRGLVHGAFKRDSTQNDVVHWGIRVEGGGAMGCRKAYHFMPNIGTIRDVDIQLCVFGIDISAANVFSSHMWIEGVRSEVSRSKATPSGGYHVRLKNVRANVSGYFEGNSRHIQIEGGVNSQTTIGPASRFSRVHKDGVVGDLGVPILYAPDAGGATLTILGVDGQDSNNNEAFIEFSASASGTINWLGQGGGFALFKDSSGNITASPPTTLAIDYFNTHRVRGLFRTSNDFQFKDNNENIAGRIEALDGATKFYFTDTVWISGGPGTPGGVVSGPVGCIWINTNDGQLYRKTGGGSGNTGWTA